MSHGSRDYDVVLYGAGGFTGRQTVAYFAAHAPADLRWAIAGPRRQTLEAARDHARAALGDADLIVAPSQDQAAVDAIVARSRIVLSTAGPFALYGTPIVDACVRFHTHYVDITGETPWMRDMAARYHEPRGGQRHAHHSGLRVRLGSLGPRRAADVAAHPRDDPSCVRGGPRLLPVQRRPQRRHGRITPEHAEESEPPVRQGKASKPRDARIRLIKRPRYDAEFGAWIGPFVMAPTNTQVVRRSLMLFEQWHTPYGPNFVYQEAMRYDQPFGRVRALGAAAGFGLLFTALKQPIARRLVEPLLPKPGRGPSVKTMDQGWFTCDLLGIADDGRQARGRIHYGGDPANRATTVFLCESALALACDTDRLPGGQYARWCADARDGTWRRARRTSAPRGHHDRHSVSRS